MKDNSDTLSITNAVTNYMRVQIALIIGETILDTIYWNTLPRTPYYLKKKIKHLEYELITKTCKINEEIVIP